MQSTSNFVFEVETFLDDNYKFRRNMLSGKTEYLIDGEWCILTVEAVNSIVRNAKKQDICEGKSPRKDIEEYINSDAIPAYDPVREYIDALPEWDGRNHVAELFGRIPGITSEQLSWLATWLRSCVAHWLHRDTLHGNECVPVLIGAQGCGKSTFANSLLPERLRTYYLDHINFGNKFDCEMALTHNLIINIDEFANMGPSQQGRLKQTLSKVKVNGRPIFGKSQEDRPRYASFVATTNDEQPLCDQTGTRRFVCLKIPSGKLIDNTQPIDYDQLFAQVVHELDVENIPYWFSNDEIIRIQQANAPFLKVEDLSSMLTSCFRILKKNDSGNWLTSSEIAEILKLEFPVLAISSRLKVRIGKALSALGCHTKHTKHGQVYSLLPITCD